MTKDHLQLVCPEMMRKVRWVLLEYTEYNQTMPTKKGLAKLNQIKNTFPSHS